MKLVLMSLMLAFITTQTRAQDVYVNPVAPAFTLSDVDGKQVSLSDFKGKIVYIDFWATWCGACVEEIPYSKQLIEKFKDNPNIVFLSISFDQDVNKWKKKVKSKKLLGIQLNSPEGSSSLVMRDYNIRFIPTFLLIGKDGIIIDAQAKKPSEEGTEEYLNKILAK